jgi:hypothetical protein
MGQLAPGLHGRSGRTECRRSPTLSAENRERARANTCFGLLKGLDARPRDHADREVLRQAGRARRKRTAEAMFAKHGAGVRNGEPRGAADCGEGERHKAREEPAVFTLPSSNGHSASTARDRPWAMFEALLNEHSTWFASGRLYPYHTPGNFQAFLTTCESLLARCRKAAVIYSRARHKYQHVSETAH